MSWTVKSQQGDWIEIYPDAGNTDDFSHATYFPEQPEGLKIASLECCPSAANDKFYLRHQSLTGNHILRHLSSSGESFTKWFGSNGCLIKLHIDFSDQVVGGTYTDWKILVQLA